MTFDEWAELLDLKAESYEFFPPKPDAKGAWRCEGPCGQLIYGIARAGYWNYPSASNIPPGNFIDQEYSRVCEVCWQMHKTLDDRAYWVGLQATNKKRYHRLKPEGDFLGT